MCFFSMGQMRDGGCKRNKIWETNSLFFSLTVVVNEFVGSRSVVLLVIVLFLLLLTIFSS